MKSLIIQEVSRFSVPSPATLPFNAGIKIIILLGRSMCSSA